jgi:hypothetical protein
MPVYMSEGESAEQIMTCPRNLETYPETVEALKAIYASTHPHAVHRETWLICMLSHKV